MSARRAFSCVQVRADSGITARMPTTCDFRACPHCGLTSCRVVKLERAWACLSCHEELVHLAAKHDCTFPRAAQIWRDWREEHNASQFKIAGHCYDHTQPNMQPG